ncbi:MAG: hypothetical protein GOVbin7759_41 [Prokaryotic dsDNA virus sp.]|jgi:transcriptional regulator with XRE-family HTH domain|nr:MAG: hypothetical protein GOVbin7759_41 [Prokaryotic dsDNA virus sp.]|tara:strand:- start:1391 stop:1567 length:177 start_codon:yes stop_codon:yes gene_type:complete
MPELEWLKKELSKRHIPDVCRATQLSDPTVRAIANGTNDNPRLKTIQAIADYLVSTGA